MEPPNNVLGAADRIPNAGWAVVSHRKLVDYLMNPAHMLGGPKWRFLMSFGFRTGDLEPLRLALLQHVREQPATFDEETEYGRKWVARGPLRSPDGRNPVISSVWQIDLGAHAPRFVTITDWDREKP